MRIFIFLILLYSVSSANVYFKNYLQNIKKQKAITYKTLLNKYFYYLDSFENGEAKSEIESNFILAYDENSIAIDIPNIKPKELMIATARYAIGIYNYDDFNKYAVIFKPDGSVQNIILLAHRFGNINFHIQRDYELKVSKEIIFFVVDKREDRDEEDGSMYISYKNIYVVMVKDAKLIQRDITDDDMLFVEDRKLNRYYKKIMAEVSKKDRSKLKNIQREWLKYINLKCSYNILHDKKFKKDCVYEAKKLRATELENLYNSLF